MYQGADPLINVTSWIFGGGGCYHSSGLSTPLGSNYSFEAKEAFVAAGGPLIDYLNVAFSLSTSWQLRHRCRPLAITLASHATMKSMRTFKNFYIGSQSTKTDYYIMATNLSISHMYFGALTGSATLISGIWLSYLVFNQENVMPKQEDSKKNDLCLTDR